MKNTEKVVGNAKFILGIQHVLAMFGATVLVPFLTGLNPSIALISAGVGTLIFHLCTKRIVPVFLGSSFAFIGALTLVLKNEGIGAIKGGVIAAGLIYVIMSFLVKTFGVEKIKSFFPPIVTGPIIMLIGLRMSPTALNMAGYANGKFDTKSLIVAFSVILTMVSITMMKKSFLRLIPILAAVIVGYIVATILGMVDFSVVSQAKWIGLSTEAASDLFTMPSMSLTGIIAIAPIALVVFIEHIGDITTNGAVVGKDFFKDPGIHRTLLGDGLATIAAGFLGGPANTTYGENTGVLAVTGVYDPAILRIAACYAIILGFIGKFGILLQTIPLPVMGGVSVILFGMIASVGVRTVVDAQLDFGNSRNLIISSIIFVLGIAVDNISIWQTVSVSGLALAAFSGVVLNKILPKDREIKLKKLD
ncbi:uracil-xanthine permease family protein [Fusobacterium mortiferum]|jgi:uracil permease|uniref:uracil-xanthine permease family protein n=1 Tax=Fusobacterium mortiferum TaxID=850 RepID=UPI000E43BEEE|nr:uracil-xanthine permease family protein [Fusobacterium mortiferum]MCF2627745.1 uracil-xanthine permease [Fusobacterium mortiferum]MCI7186955.1 uracil-xanthine permease family protein [Fusobacterium mortiferum]MCI7664825.1 uracil-xanthine permease family protein [Fusobacterium mortiferum]MDD7262010.1 uracil-xanthine permease family protein [Fusobacterium mortiferum]MDY4801981.1 uracil-xanthine permease family protein [Fusobacterium mortiferum]